MLYEIWLSMIMGIGPVNARKLVSFCGSAEGVYRERSSLLRRIPGIGDLDAEVVGDVGFDVIRVCQAHTEGRRPLHLH